MFSVSKQRRVREWRCLFVFLTFGMMFFMMACRRADVGNDTQAYVKFFENIASGNLNYNRRIEIGFRYLTRLISCFTSSAQVYLTICVALAFIPYLIFLVKTSKNLEFSISMFWLVGCTGITSATRQGIAIGIILMGYLSLRKGTIGSSILYCILCVLASLFHTASIVLIILVFLNKRKITIKVMLIITIISLFLTATNLVAFVFSRYVGSYYSLYSEIQSGWAAALFNMLYGVAAYIIEYSTLAKNKKKKSIPRDYTSNGRDTVAAQNDTKCFRWTTIFYIACCILSVNSGIMGREGSYFSPFLIVYLSNHVKKLKHSRFVMVSILLARIGYSILALVIRPEWNSFFPFFYFWQ